MLQARRDELFRLRLAGALENPAVWRRRFGVLLGGIGLACLLLFAVVLADRWLVRLALREAGARAQDEVALGLSGRVTAADFQPPADAEQLADVNARLDALLAGLTAPGSGILRVNLISVTGTIVYSDRPTLRGTVLPVEDHHQLSEALAGSLSVERSTLDSEENRDLRTPFSTVIEVYVPVRIDGQVVGAYEIYQDPGLLRATELVLWLGAAAIVVFLLVVQYVVPSKRQGRNARVPAPAGRAADLTAAPASTRSVRLSPRELEVLRLMPDHTTRDIAHRLVLSDETVRTHIKSIMHKLNCSSRASAVLAAVKAGLLELPE